MRKRFHFRILLFPALLGLLMLAGCGGKSADQYVGEQITAMKEKDPGAFTFLLEQGITESNTLYTLQFPEELRTPTLDFLQDYNSMAKQYQTLHRKYEAPGKPTHKDGVWHCPACNSRVQINHSHCHRCGKRLGWR